MPDHADVQQVAAMIEPLRTEMMLGSAGVPPLEERPWRWPVHALSVIRRWPESAI